MSTPENPCVPPDQVLLYHNSVPVAVCSTKLITQDSLELYCGPLRYERNTGLEVEMQFHPGWRGNRVRLHTRVVRCDKNHLVLSYESLPEEVETLLQEWQDMAAHPDAAAQPTPSSYAH
ncbi:MAG TPA: hypothetical protein VKA48_12020 [Gammaproteobacteria bacterium]|nr:hypothetical protein [Gammaproteobacteria bacterium]